MLHRVLIACLLFGRRCHTDFEWAGRQRLINHIVGTIVSADEFYFSFPRRLYISNNAVAKTSIAYFLVAAVDAFRISIYGGCDAPPWDIDKIDAIIKTIRDRSTYYASKLASLLHYTSTKISHIRQTSLAASHLSMVEVLSMCKSAYLS